MYEIVGVSHGDAGYASRSESATKPGLNNLDLGGVFDALIDALDQWAEQGVEPGPTRSDAPFLGDADGAMEKSKTLRYSCRKWLVPLEFTLNMPKALPGRDGRLLSPT